MKIIFTFLLIAIAWTACSVKPEPLVMGKDACHTCKMTLVDEKFGGEIITKKGKIYKFDDMNCMVNFTNSLYEPKENISSYLVADYSHPKQLLDATEAFYCQSTSVKSPMGGNTAAFNNKEEMEKFNSAWQGSVVTWGELSEEVNDRK